MSEAKTGTQLSRRQFLSTCGAVGASAALTSAPVAADDAQNTVSERHPSTAPGQISLKGKAAIADVDRRRAQQRGPIERTVSAASLDITPDRPINETLPSAVDGLSNVRVEFAGNQTFTATGRIMLSPDGPIELVGNGTTIRLPEGVACYVFNCPELPSGTLIQGFTADMSASGAVTGVRVGTDGTVELRDITLAGYADPSPEPEVQGILMPIARTPDATVRMTRFKAVGGTAAGMHSDPSLPDSAPANRLSAPMGLWVGQANLGTIQMVECQLRGWNNGTYAGRTPGVVGIYGGTYWDNANAQNRIGGGSIVDGATLSVDARRYSDPGPYELGSHQGVHCVRVETGGEKGNQSDPVTFVNVDFRGIAVETSSSLVNLEGTAPHSRFENCRFTNHMDVPSILAATPGSQASYGAAPQTQVYVSHSLFQGSGEAESVIDVNERPNSRIHRSCIAVPGAGPESISGMQIGLGVGFGKQCKYGLKNPKKVGDGNPPGKLPIPDNPGGASGPNNPAREGPSKGVFVAVIDGIFMLLLLLVGMVVLFVAAIVGAIGALAGMIGGD